MWLASQSTDSSIDSSIDSFIDSLINVKRLVASFVFVYFDAAMLKIYYTYSQRVTQICAKFHKQLPLAGDGIDGVLLNAFTGSHIIIVDTSRQFEWQKEFFLVKVVHWKVFTSGFSQLGQSVQHVEIAAFLSKLGFEAVSLHVPRMSKSQIWQTCLNPYFEENPFQSCKLTKNKMWWCVAVVDKVLTDRQADRAPDGQTWMLSYHVVEGGRSLSI